MPDHEPVASMTMIEKKRSGDNDAWVRLTNIYGPLVHVQCIRKGLQIANAKNVTMEVFQSVFQSLDRFNRDHESFRFLRYLQTITTRHIADHLRKEERRKDRPMEAKNPGFATAFSP